MSFPRTSKPIGCLIERDTENEVVIEKTDWNDIALEPKVKERVIRETIIRYGHLAKRADDLAFCIAWLKTRIEDVDPERVDVLRDHIINSLEANWERTDRVLRGLVRMILENEETRVNAITDRLLELAKLAGKDF